MDCGLFGVRFLFLGHKNGAATPVDYLSTFATAPERMVKTGVQKASVPKSRSLLVTEELLRWCLQSKPYRWCQ